MTPQELKAKSHKSITCPQSGQEFEIRMLTFIEFNEANISAVLGTAMFSDKVEGELQKSIHGKAQDSKLRLDGLRLILDRGIVAPKIVFAEEKGETVPDGAIDARWIATDLPYIVDQILLWSGLSTEETKSAEELAAEALAKNAPSPALSTT
jgi:hypothetical protein